MTRLFAEGLVVIVSILIAFSLDAWWDGRMLDRQLFGELANIRTQLETNRARVAFQIETMDRIVVASDEVVLRLDSSGSSETLTVPDSLAAWAFSVPTLDPSLGAVEALNASGQLSHIESPVLRQLLAGLRESFNDAIEDQLQAREAYFTFVHPLLAGVTDFSGLVRVQEEWWSENTGLSKPYPSYGDVQIPSAPELRSAILLRRLYYRVTIDQLNGVDEELRRAIELINQQ